MEFKERVLAIVLLDLIGSTAFVQKVGAKRAAEWLQYHDRLTRSLLYKFNGREIDRSDGFMLSFDRLIDAVNFSVHYQLSIPRKTKLNTRIGVHWAKVVEVIQDELYVGVGAKRIELEGIAKNITARTMSICLPGQVLLTKEAVKAAKGRTNTYTPQGTRYACVGIYRFKGVKDLQEIYAVGTTLSVLQPPPSSDKVKRVGGPKKIKSRARDRKLIEWLWWLSVRLCFIIIFCLLVESWPAISNPHVRRMWGHDWLFWWTDYVNFLFEPFRKVLNL
jgi:class 3 adenylate cyclase